MQGRLDGILLLKHPCPVVLPIRAVKRNDILVSSSLVANWRHLWGFLQGDYTLEVNQGVAHILSYLLLKIGSLKVLNHRILPVLL